MSATDDLIHKYAEVLEGIYERKTAVKELIDSSKVVVLALSPDYGIVVTTHPSVWDAEKCLVVNFGDEEDTTDTIYDSMEFNHPDVVFSITEHEPRP